MIARTGFFYILTTVSNLMLHRGANNTTIAINGSAFCGVKLMTLVFTGLLPPNISQQPMESQTAITGGRQNKDLTPCIIILVGVSTATSSTALISHK